MWHVKKKKVKILAKFKQEIVKSEKPENEAEPVAFLSKMCFFLILENMAH